MRRLKGEDDVALSSNGRSARSNSQWRGPGVSMITAAGEMRPRTETTGAAKWHTGGGVSDSSARPAYSGKASLEQDGSVRPAMAR